MGAVWTGLMQSVGASRKVFEYIDKKPEISNDGQLEPTKLEGRIEFKDVSFSYPSRPETKVLKVQTALFSNKVTLLVFRKSVSLHHQVKQLPWLVRVEGAK